MSDAYLAAYSVISSCQYQEGISMSSDKTEFVLSPPVRSSTLGPSFRRVWG